MLCFTSDGHRLFQIQNSSNENKWLMVTKKLSCSRANLLMQENMIIWDQPAPLWKNYPAYLQLVNKRKNGCSNL